MLVLTMSKKSLEVIILAAGLGTRMKSNMPKVVHPVCGVAMLELLMVELDKVLRSSSAARFNIVIGHGREIVTDLVNALVQSRRIHSPVAFTVQEQQLGTGHAVLLALSESKSQQYNDGAVAVFNGDLPLFTSAAFLELLEAHDKAKSSATLSSMTVNDPGAYGRVVRKGKSFERVVEYKDASVKEKSIHEVNGGVYLFDRKTLVTAIARVGNKNKAGEYYLPRVFELTKKAGKKILAHHFSDPTVLWGVNNMVELSQAQKALYKVTATKWMVEGVSFVDADATYVGPYVKLSRGCTVGPGTIIEGQSQFGEGVKIGGQCLLKDIIVEEGAVIRHGTCAEKSQIGEKAIVGPMAHLRPGTVLGAQVKVGNFVEIKESVIGANTAISHLSYVGDAEVGRRVNIGCGFVTCNYDGLVREGRRKHKSIIGDDAFIGSDCQVVAPLELAAGTFVASGSTVTQSVVEPHSLVVARAKQVTKPGYARKYKK